MKHTCKSILSGLLFGVISYLIIWFFLHVISKNHAIPNPWSSLIVMWHLKGSLFVHTLASSTRILVALLLSIIVGVPIGIALSLFARVNRFFSPLLYFIYPLPKVAFLPIFMIFWGLGNFSKILLLFSIIVLQIILMVRDGVKQIPTNYQRTMTNFHANAWQKIIYLVLPAIYPTLLASLRVSIGIALASLFFAENYATTYGLGYFIISAWTKMDYTEMFAGIFCIALLGFFLFRIIDYFEKYTYQP